MPRPRNALTAALALATVVGITGVITCTASRALADPSSPGGVDASSMTVNTKTKTFVHMKDYNDRMNQEFINKHMDSNGMVRPDLEQQGLDHIRTMKTAPSLGAKVSGATSAPASNPTK
jgi:Rieske Fe-S protein